MVENKMETNKQKVEERYEKLSSPLKSRLTDTYNHWVGVSNVVFGRWNFDDFYSIYDNKEDSFVKAVPSFIISQIEGITEIDLEHISDFSELAKITNSGLAERTMDQPKLKETYDLGMSYMYGGNRVSSWSA